MSKYYTCEIYLDVVFNQETLNMIIKKGKELKFIFLTQKSYSDSLADAQHMTEQEAIEHLIAGRTEKKNDYDFPKCLTILYNTTYFSLTPYEENNMMSIRFLSLSNAWEKNFNGKEYFDFGRYIKLLIDLCEDFPIVKIETEIDY